MAIEVELGLRLCFARCLHLVQPDHSILQSDTHASRVLLLFNQLILQRDRRVLGLVSLHVEEGAVSNLASILHQLTHHGILEAFRFKVLCLRSDLSMTLTQLLVLRLEYFDFFAHLSEVFVAEA